MIKRKHLSDGLAGFAYLLQALWLTHLPWNDWMHAIPRGSEGADAVPLFNLWTLRWTYQAPPKEWWHAPIFYPVRGAFALSDPQPLTGWLAWPWQSISPALAYNLVLLLFLVLNAWSAYQLLRWRQMERVPAWAAGALLMALPFFTQERGVLQLQPVFGMLWAWRGLWGIRQASHNARDVLYLAGGVVVTFATSEYYGLFLVILLALPALQMVWQRPSRWRALALAGGLALPFLALYLWPQMDILQQLGYRRSLESIQKNAASLIDWLQTPPTVFASHFMPRLPGHKQHLFPGLVLLALGISGGWLAARQAQHRPWARALGESIGMALLLSLPWPYLWLQHLPGIGNLRSPFRWLVWVQVALALLSVHSLQHLWKKGRALMVVVLVASLLETAPLPAPWAPVPAPLPADSLQGPTLFLPVVEGRTPKHYEQTVRWMVQSLGQDAWLINGYSGYIPSFQRQMRVIEAHFPDDYSLQLLQDAGIQTLVIDRDWLPEAKRARLRGKIASGALPSPQSVDNLLIFRWPTAPEPHLLQNFAGNWRVDLRASDGNLRLYLYPQVEEARGYLLAPDLYPFRFLVSIDGEHQELQPARAVFFYPDSQRAIYIKIPWQTAILPRVNIFLGDGQPLPTSP